MLQHEDGFSSGLRVAAEHLGAKPPFHIRHAERDLTQSVSDKILALCLGLAESCRRPLAMPFHWCLTVLIVIMAVAEIGLGIVVGALDAVGAERAKDRALCAKSAASNVLDTWRASTEQPGASSASSEKMKRM